MASPWLFRVDFNDVGEEDGCTIAVLVGGPNKPMVGDLALLVDDEWNRCLATIRSVEGRIVDLEIDPDSWREVAGDGDPPTTLPKATVVIRSQPPSAYGKADTVLTSRELVPA